MNPVLFLLTVAILGAVAGTLGQAVALSTGTLEGAYQTGVATGCVCMVLGKMILGK